MTTQSIFITGAASGIGRAVAHYFGERGWFVGLADINDAGMEETAAGMQQGQFSIHHLDVTDRAQWKQVIEAFGERTGGRMDVLFNNAGIGIGGPLQEMSDEDIDKTIAINFTGVIDGTRAAFEMLRNTPDSCVLNTSSAAGIYGAAGLVVYSGTKFAVRALTEGLDIEFRPYGIRVRDLMPSFIETPILDGPLTGGNSSVRDMIADAGLEITPVSEVAEAAWIAVHGEKVHTTVGKTAKKLAFAARWTPNRLRKSLGMARTVED
ncbi:SDR family oxidoreductase [Parasphingopyxis sp.]|uniref:SDR family oxidoreductase n=1 Tax=Parasphingopyxis sp. TaxID=1920299 RepID=UPI002604C9D7|nr:SDR family oxidoreductase [Parasphingopyxis sp.]